VRDAALLDLGDNRFDERMRRRLGDLLADSGHARAFLLDQPVRFGMNYGDRAGPDIAAGFGWAQFSQSVGDALPDGESAAAGDSLGHFGQPVRDEPLRNPLRPKHDDVLILVISATFGIESR
jgi:hypothetical protein